MTDPQSELITMAFLAKLQAIREADGYYTTPAAQRYDRSDRTIVDRPAICLRKKAERKQLSASKYDCTLSLEVEALVSDPDDADFSTDQLVAFLQDDIERAIAEVDWESLHAPPPDYEVTNLLDIDPNDPEDGVIVTVTVRYAHDEKNTRQPLPPG